LRTICGPQADRPPHIFSANKVSAYILTAFLKLLWTVRLLHMDSPPYTVQTAQNLSDVPQT